jgi:predicted nucleic acid-binding protein
MDIKAKIIDIRSTDPTGDFAFFVDTNAWYWMTYTRASTKGLQAPEKHQLEQYLRFIKKAREAGSSIYRCSLSFAELAHRIEVCERQICSLYRRGGAVIKSKAFRHDAAERPNVLAEIEGSWEQVKSMSESISLPVDDGAATEAMTLLKACAVDGYDAFHVQALQRGNLTAVLTDDADFATIPGIAVLTGNLGLLGQATREGHLKDGKEYFAPKN